MKRYAVVLAAYVCVCVCLCVPAVPGGDTQVLQLRLHGGFCHRGHSQTHRLWPSALFQREVFTRHMVFTMKKNIPSSFKRLFKRVFVCWCVKMEPAGPRHRVVVHHGNHIGGNRPECFPPHQPHHHTDHESPEDNTRYMLSDANTRKKQTRKQTPPLICG